MTTNEIVQGAVQAGEIATDDLQLLIDISKLEVPEPTMPDQRAGSEEEGVEVQRLPTTGAGYVNLRRVSDGKVKNFPRTLLYNKLKQVLPDGRMAWANPSKPWEPLKPLPDYHCLLSNLHPNGEEYQALGFAPCPKITHSAQAQTNHMRVKHGDAWEAIQHYLDEQHVSTRDKALIQGLAEAFKTGQAPAVGAQLTTEGMCPCGWGPFNEADMMTHLKSHPNHKGA